LEQLTHYDIKNNQKQFPITIVCDAIRTPENIGMCFRISESFGVKKIYFHEDSPTVENRIVKKTARNTAQQILYDSYADFTEIIKKLKTEGNTIIGIEITDKSINIQDFNFASEEKNRLTFG
jgi:23S rRNA (guanosine2251-2'-O)-methyltransferase